MPYCTSCGSEVHKGSHFCTNCGAPSARVKNTHTKPQQRNQADVQPQNNTDSAPREAGPRLGVLSCVLAVFWLLFSSGLLALVMNQGGFDGDEFLWAAANADWITAGIFVGLPLAVSALGPLLDRVLMPIEILKAAAPYRLLVALGLTAPFIVTWFLSGVLRFQGYTLLHASVFFGMLITYIIMREPGGAVE